QFLGISMSSSLIEFGPLQSSLVHARNEEITQPQSVCAKAPQCVGNKSLCQRFETTVGQRDDVCFESVNFDGVDCAKPIRDRAPFMRRAKARNRAIHGSLSYVMHTSVLSQLCLEYSFKKATHDVVVPPRSMIDHNSTLTRRP